MTQASLPPGLSAGERVVLFDGVCKLCNGWAKFLIRHDRQHRFRLASVQSPQGQALLAWYGLPTDRFDTMALIDDAGKEATLKRDRLRTLIGFAIDYYRTRLRERPTVTGQPGGSLDAVRALDACLTASEYVDRNANLGLVIQNWCEELTSVGAGTC